MGRIARAAAEIVLAVTVVALDANGMAAAIHRDHRVHAVEFARTTDVFNRLSGTIRSHGVS